MTAILSPPQGVHDDDAASNVYKEDHNDDDK